MITEKDFTYVGLDYINPNLTYNPDYNHTELTFNNGGCNLSKLKNSWKRFLAFFWDGISTEELMNKYYTNKVIKLTCKKEKLLQLSKDELNIIGDRIIKKLATWKINIQKVVIYAI